MPKVKSKTPSSSFGPELLAALREGTNKRIELAFDTQAMAIRFAARINALRAAMRREGHSDSDRLYRAGVYRDGCLVVIAPKDSEFRSVLEKAQITTEPPPTVSHYEVPTPKPGVENDPAADFLATLTEATTVPPKDEKNS